MIIVPDSNPQSLVIMSRNEHKHEQKERNPTTRLPSPIRKSVSTYVKYGLSQTQIKSSLGQDHPNAPITHKRTVDDVFNRNIDLLMQKWNATPTTKKFSDYFADQWIAKLLYWYEGAAFGKQSMNAIIKQKYTLRNKLHLSAFLPKMEQMFVNGLVVRKVRTALLAYS
ncbi:unnamed protein product [Didymodactylos carnosus]|uniref:Uncharacterized protein n=1 Tax=Didymodactylos carnosus TaxID=1234261 RepID=A0A813S9H1_9BILA|nr:unnamed protein product [Didymodactylos carnosus]CAF3576327.1 unnamed protein product [Didymodactylos carnosus]